MHTISPFLVYLWTILDEVKETYHFIGWIVSTAAFLVTMCGCQLHYLENFWEEKAQWKKVKFSFIFLWLVGAFLQLTSPLIPTSRNLATIIVAPEIVNSSVIQRDLPELYDVGVKALKESLAGKKKEDKE
jgi:hypothetical protein